MRAIVSFAVVGMFCVGVVALMATFLSAPSFNADLRESELVEDWRDGASMALFNAPMYRRSRAFLYLSLVEGEDDIDLVDAAQDLALRAVSGAPSDAFAWSLLAWAELLRGEDDCALRALERSWTLAPINTALASDRVLVADSLGLFIPGEATPEQTRALARDARQMMQTSPDFVASLVDTMPELGSLMDAPAGGS